MTIRAFRMDLNPAGPSSEHSYAAPERRPGVAVLVHEHTGDAHRHLPGRAPARPRAATSPLPIHRLGAVSRVISGHPDPRLKNTSLKKTLLRTRQSLVRRYPPNLPTKKRASCLRHEPGPGSCETGSNFARAPEFGARESPFYDHGRCSRNSRDLSLGPASRAYGRNPVPKTSNVPGVYRHIPQPLLTGYFQSCQEVVVFSYFEIEFLFIS